MTGMITSILILIFIFDEKIPDLQGVQEGVQLAEKMSKAINKSSFDSLIFISWQYGSHRYDWNKKEDSVKVIWANFEVNVSTQTLEGIAYHKGVILKGNENTEIVEKAIRYFNNDSFWLVAPYKIYDPGVRLNSVILPEGHGLMVTYTKGGSTPGDTYLWILDENYFPRAFE